MRFLLAGIVLGLERIHSLKLVYRAVDLDGIMIRANGYPVLANLAMVFPEGSNDPKEQNGAFRSPEEFRNMQVTRATDLWTVGILLHYISVGDFVNFSLFKERNFRCSSISRPLESLINELLLFRPEDRLGYKDMS